MKHFLAFCAAAALLLAADAPAADPRLGAGSAHSLGLHADGTVRAWGSDDNGMLGLRREMNYPDPRALAGFEGIAVVAIGTREPTSSCTPSRPLRLCPK